MAEAWNRDDRGFVDRDRGRGRDHSTFCGNLPRRTWPSSPRFGSPSRATSLWLWNFSSAPTFSRPQSRRAGSKLVSWGPIAVIRTGLNSSSRWKCKANATRGRRKPAPHSGTIFVEAASLCDTLSAIRPPLISTSGLKEKPRGSQTNASFTAVLISSSVHGLAPTLSLPAGTMLRRKLVNESAKGEAQHGRRRASEDRLWSRLTGDLPPRAGRCRPSEAPQAKRAIS